MDIERIDLLAVARYLASEFRDAPARGAIVGRTRMRDALVSRLHSSQLEAEMLVDTLVMHGFLVLRDSPETESTWCVRPE